MKAPVQPPPHGMGSFAQIMLGLIAGLMISQWIYTPLLRAQYPIKTPRDTVYVPANRMTFTTAKVGLVSNVVWDVTVTGTYGAFSGQNASGFDGLYTYSVPNWNAPFPLKSPPSFNGTSYDVLATYVSFPQLTQEHPLSDVAVTNSYQQNHAYTCRIRSEGTQLRFRIKDRLNERSDGYYYSQASGGLTMYLAQFTAGISLEKNSLDFGATNIGFQSRLPFSIASYGIDPLQVDSVWIEGANASQFSFSSQRGSIFTLPNESSNLFTVSYSPSTVGSAYAIMVIRTANTDGPNHIKTIALKGVGATPKLAIGPKPIDFGLVRAGFPKSQNLNIVNGGNAELKITSIRLVPDANSTNAFSSLTDLTSITPAAPLRVLPGIPMSITFRFNPTAKGHFTAKVYFTAIGVPNDSVLLQGDGAEPLFGITTQKLNFGSTRSYNQVVRYDTVYNHGSWTSNVVKVELGGPASSAYHFTPVETSFLLDPDSIRIYRITFQPATKSDGVRSAYLRFSFDNGAASQTIDLEGTEIKPRIAYDTNFVDFGKVKVNGVRKRGLGIENSSSAPLSLMYNFDFMAPQSFWCLQSPPISLTPGRDTMQLSFVPKQRGPLHNWLRCYVNDQIDSIYVFGFGAMPKAVFNPPIIDVGVSPTGTKSSSFSVLTDTGDYPLYIDSVRVTGPSASYFTVIYDASHALKDSVMDGGVDKRYITVQFQSNGRSGKTHYGRVEVFYNDGTFDTVQCVAREAAQFVQYSSKRVDFGKVQVGKQKKLPATFSNGADIRLTVGKIWASPAGGPFYEGQTTTTVDARSNTDVPVTFAPAARGSYTGFLHADEGDMKGDSIPMTGIGAQAIPVLSDTAIDFGTVALKSTSPSRTLVLHNKGDWELPTRIFKAKDGYNEFKVVAERGLIAPTIADTAREADSLVFTISFTPLYPQLPEHEADLIFEYEDGTQQTVILTGKDTSHFLAVDSTHVNFGKVRIGAVPANRMVRLINTSPRSLTADQVQLLSGSPIFSATPTGSVPVAGRKDSPITVSFQPTAIGPAAGVLIGQGSAFENPQGDTVQLEGIGAQPVPVLSTTSLDLGSYIVGVGGSMSFDLTNQGNWSLVTHASISGPNAADFTLDVPADTSIDEGGTARWNVTFLATTPGIVTDRTATLTFTQDDGKTFTLELIAHDKAPLQGQIGFGSYIARPGDKVITYMRLRNAVPKDLNIQKLTGTVTYDPAIVTLSSVEAGSLLPTPNWSVVTATPSAGTITYDISSATEALEQPGVLLRVTFVMNKGLAIGALSALKNSCNFPTTKEAVALGVDGAIVLDSSCGSVHITAGLASATFIDQNTPNPFGGEIHSTSIPFDIGADGTIVTLRILDPTGREVARPIQEQIYQQGHYSIDVDAQTLGRGVFFYEFKTSGAKPMVKKMVVE